MFSVPGGMVAPVGRPGVATARPLASGSSPGAEMTVHVRWWRLSESVARCGRWRRRPDSGGGRDEFWEPGRCPAAAGAAGEGGGGVAGGHGGEETAECRHTSHNCGFCGARAAERNGQLKPLKISAVLSAGCV